MSTGRAAAFLDATAPTSGAPGFASFGVEMSCTALELVRELIPSRTMVARVFDGGGLRDAKGSPLARASQLAPGMTVTFELRATRMPGPLSDEALVVLYQDPFLIAVDKPAGILVHGDGSDAQTLTAQVQGHLLRQGSAAVPQALHRLHVDTSVIVLFSLTEEFQPAFDAMVAGDGMRKRYSAVIEGKLPQQAGAWLQVEAPIARDRHDARRMRVGRTGKPALTRLRTVATKGNLSLVEAELATGRRHQIRVHLAHLGHPIVGDALYGGRRHAKGLMLHAHEVRLVHPVTNKQLVIVSQAPERFPLFPKR